MALGDHTRATRFGKTCEGMRGAQNRTWRRVDTHSALAYNTNPITVDNSMPWPAPYSSAALRRTARYTRTPALRRQPSAPEHSPDPFAGREPCSGGRGVVRTLPTSHPNRATHANTSAAPTATAQREIVAAWPFMFGSAIRIARGRSRPEAPTSGPIHSFAPSVSLIPVAARRISLFCPIEGD